MENQPLTKHTQTFGLALALASIANALLDIAKEKSHTLQAQMQKLTGHHWITHAAIILLLFVLTGWTIAKPNNRPSLTLTTNRLITTILTAVFTSTLLIIGYYLIAD